MALVADAAFASEELSVTMAWLGAFAYAFQIFFDFSGYSDMAIGLGKMFGFHFLENFDYPYVSKSISEFWRRWHMSLSSWFRDYVYFPLGGSRVDTKLRLVFNLFVVWFLTGVWHGANWTFLVWGLMYFVLITLEKLTKFDKKLGRFGHVYTMFFVLLGWVIFRAVDLSQGITYILNMFGVGASGFIDEQSMYYLLENSGYFIFSIILSLPICKSLSKRIKGEAWDFVYQVFLLILFIVSISFIVTSDYNPFIYFNF